MNITFNDMFNQEYERDGMGKPSTAIIRTYIREFGIRNRPKYVKKMNRQLEKVADSCGNYIDICFGKCIGISFVDSTCIPIVHNKR